MKIINLKIDVLKPYDKNPRKNKEAVKYVAESIKEFGFKQPIVIDKIMLLFVDIQDYLLQNN
nr:MAG TPA: ParB protein [Caudoviricetes sp.]